ncbi:hypothetical protein CRUP_037118, partial [Coryphaenoides rupestris]
MASVGLRVFVCRASSVLFYLTMYVSILFFGLISVDRCRKTLTPFRGTTSARLTRRKLLSAAVWCSLLALCLPNVALTRGRPPGASPRFKCGDLKTEAGLWWHEVVNHVCQVIFWVNLVTVMVCYALITKELYVSYSRANKGGAAAAAGVTVATGGPSPPRKRSMSVNVFLVLAVFFVCFVPFHFARVPYTLSQTRGRLFNCQLKLFFFQLKESTLWLSSLNSLLDPLIHFFLCRSFRTTLFRTLRLSPGTCSWLTGGGSSGPTTASTPLGGSSSADSTMASNSTGPDCLYMGISYDAFAVGVSCLYFCTFPIALFLNGVAAWICVHLRSASSFMVYLKHLVAADLLMTLTVPLMAAGNLRGAADAFKAFACRFSNVVFYWCMYTSITLMGLISLDRFFKIVQPGGKLLGQSPVFSHAMATCVWAALFFGTALPTFILTDSSPQGNATGDLCMSMKGLSGLRLHQGVIVSVDVLFWFVSVVVVLCYACITKTIVESFRNSGSSNSRGTARTKLRVFLVVLVFFVCFMPLHIMRIPFSHQETQSSARASPCAARWMEMAYDVALWLSSTNVCLDPLLYIYLCKEFREKL